MFAKIAIDHCVLNMRAIEVSSLWCENVFDMKRAPTEPKENVEYRMFLSFIAQQINLRPETAA